MCTLLTFVFKLTMKTQHRLAVVLLKKNVKPPCIHPHRFVHSRSSLSSFLRQWEICTVPTRLACTSRVTARWSVEIAGASPSRFRETLVCENVPINKRCASIEGENALVASLEGNDLPHSFAIQFSLLTMSHGLHYLPA